MRTSIITQTALVLALAGAGCATAAPPPELTSARASYKRAERGPAAKYDPADLHTANKALAAAEKSFAEDGDTQATRDLAYTAGRRAQIAEARARAEEATQQQQAIIAAMHSRQAEHVKATASELGRTKQQLELQSQEMVNQTEKLAAAEKRAAQAASDLAKVASVKEDSARGMVITLSGGVIFASGKSELLPGAQVKLNAVAEALTQQDPDSRMVVEGHTDSQGSASYNQSLSERRAQTVRDYIVSRGIAADRVTSVGYGPTRPIADNGSAEGRANNRRVEIVVEPQGARIK